MRSFIHVKSIIVIILLFSLNTYSQQSDEFKTKAILLERFSRFVTWPEEIDSTFSFKILVYGEHSFGNLLDIIYSDLKVKNRNAEIHYSNQVTDSITHDIIFVGAISRKQMNDLLSLVSDKPILLIGDTEGYMQAGVHINILIEEGSIVFEMNKKCFEGSNLKCSHLLYKQAKYVLQ